MAKRYEDGGEVNNDDGPETTGGVTRRDYDANPPTLRERGEAVLKAFEANPGYKEDMQRNQHRETFKTDMFVPRTKGYSGAVDKGYSKGGSVGSKLISMRKK